MSRISSRTTNGKEDDPKEDEEDVSKVIESILSGDFQGWYEEKKAKDNLKNGKPYYNEPSSVPDPKRHSPSSLLQCSRKLYYRQLNAPEENEDPHGIFWLGSKFEEEFVLSYLEDVVPDRVYVGNSYWVDFTVETEIGELQFRGETDPVIVAEDGQPLILVEVKTKSSISNLEAPNRHHRAQIHPYLYGLSQQHEQNVTDAIILYGSRDTFEASAFHVEFDPVFWRTVVLQWAVAHTRSRINEQLPQADPEFDWECGFCSYRERCGRGETVHQDEDVRGFLPLFADYPRKKVVDYLESDPEAVLTPTLAHRYPELAETNTVGKWRCDSCTRKYDWDVIEWDRDTSDPPVCKACLSEKVPSPLHGPMPDEKPSQAYQMENDE
ncbi:CRISPR-associated protein Cas4 [Natronorarus salvus]|uniref:CRISPR-associated protein Cas4 n=1 Tax=Natronorarus salvus TaxID=3117733 RepID=UPI002F26C653